MFHIIEHTADIAIRLEGENRIALFRSGFEGVIHLLTDGIEFDHDMVTAMSITADGHDYEELMVNALNELLYCCQNLGWIPLSVDSLSVDKHKMLTATISVLKNKANILLIREIKAATFHNLTIEKIDNKWQTTVVFDV